MCPSQNLSISERWYRMFGDSILKNVTIGQFFLVWFLLLLRRIALIKRGHIFIWILVLNKPILDFSQYTQCLLVSKSDHMNTRMALRRTSVNLTHRHKTKQRQWVRAQTAAPPWSGVWGCEWGRAFGIDTGTACVQRLDRAEALNGLSWNWLNRTTEHDFRFSCESAKEKILWVTHHAVWN